jgi:pyrimidine operon attenuation protein/uracil phosphoribosyltransferase
MPMSHRTPLQRELILNEETMRTLILQMAREVTLTLDESQLETLALMGILRRGKPLADRLADALHGLLGKRPPVGALSTTLYRDDVRVRLGEPSDKAATYFDFDVTDRTILLVDDVLAAGRTIRAAMDEVMDYGRPRCIQLACLVDRGGRELPIQPDYRGWIVHAQPHQWVAVRLKELDGEDAVYVETYAPHEGIT